MPHLPHHRSDPDPTYIAHSAGALWMSQHPSSKLFVIPGIDNTSTLPSQSRTSGWVESGSKSFAWNDDRNNNPATIAARTPKSNNNEGDTEITPGLTPDEAHYIQSMISLSSDNSTSTLTDGEADCLPVAGAPRMVSFNSKNSKSTLIDREPEILCQSFSASGVPRLVSIRQHSFLKRRKKDLELLTVMRSISDTLRSAVDLDRSKSGSGPSTAMSSRRESFASSDGVDQKDDTNENEEELLADDMLPVVKELLGKCKRFATHDPAVETELSSLKETLYNTYDILLKRRLCTLEKQVSNLRETASRMRAHKAAEKDTHTKKVRWQRRTETKAGHTGASVSAHPIRKKAEMDEVAERVPKMPDESVYLKHQIQPANDISAQMPDESVYSTHQTQAVDDVPFNIPVSSSTSRSWPKIRFWKLVSRKFKVACKRLVKVFQRIPGKLFPID
ncbi:hypothetical protein HK102_001522 [Quaeritorhiza haematococci]|nr:hypothetical protein HK102_001522 [Quaeritorhiza haematococci]